MAYVPFVDVMGVNSTKIPAVAALRMIALYATGSEGIQATSAEIARFKNAGVAVVLIDQSPSLSVFAAGRADIADVEQGAGTTKAAVAAILDRQAHGLQSTIYVSRGNLDSMTSAFTREVDRGQVRFGVADYSWSQAQAEKQLAANPSWAYCQYGDPESNPDTLVPGTKLTLAQAQCDIDIAQSSWADQFMLTAYATPTGESQTVWPTGVNFGWQPVTGAGAYHVQVAQGSDNVVDEHVTTPYLHGVQLASGSYQWRVAADRSPSHLASAWSSWRPFTVSSAEPS
jgi:hypothetical protein